MKPVEILCITVLGMILTRYLLNLAQFIYSNMTISNIKIQMFRFAACVIPQVSGKLEEERKKMNEGSIKKFADARRSTSVNKLPEMGTNTDTILARV